MGLRRLFARHPLAAALVAEGLMIPLALGLAWLLGLAPWTEFRFSWPTLLLAVAATVPLAGGLLLSAALGSRWFRELERLVRQAIESLFAGHGHAAVIVVAAMAGLAEELLFRGVLQAWLVGLTGPWAGVLFASLLFGLVHAVTPAYFALATIMGLYLGALYQLTGDLLLVSMVHAFYDWVAIEYVRRGLAGETEPPAAD